MDIEELKSQVIVNIHNLSELTDEEKQQKALQLLNDLNALFKEGKIVKTENPVKEELEEEDANNPDNSVNSEPDHVEIVTLSPDEESDLRKNPGRIKKSSGGAKSDAQIEDCESLVGGVTIRITNAEPEECEPKKKTRKKDGVVKAEEVPDGFEKRTDGWYCLACGRRFNCRANVKVHLRTHTGEKPFTCDICERSFAVKVNYSRHMLRHSSDTPFKCLLCPKAYTEKRHLDQHMKTHAIDPLTGEMKKQPIRGRVCEECGKTFVSPSYLRVHILTHSQESPHECEICGKKYRFMSNLRQHRHSTHRHEVEPLAFTCNVCSKSFSREAWLLHHQKNLHSSDEQKPIQFSCPQCGKLFDTRQLMMVHRAEDHNRWYSCHLCEQRFIWRYLLNEHVTSAHGKGAPRYPCTQCPRSFSRKSALKRHGTSHQQKKPFNCKECGRSYSYKSSLVTHKSTHSNDSHACSQCGQNFSLSAGLKRHLAYHKAERPFECDVCGKAFVIKGDLKRHKNIHLKTAEGAITLTSEENMNTEILLLPSDVTDEGANQELIFLQTDSNQPIILNGQSLEEFGIVIETPDQI